MQISAVHRRHVGSCICSPSASGLCELHLPGMCLKLTSSRPRVAIHGTLHASSVPYFNGRAFMVSTPERRDNNILKLHDKTSVLQRCVCLRSLANPYTSAATERGRSVPSSQLRDLADFLQYLGLYGHSYCILHLHTGLSTNLLCPICMLDSVRKTHAPLRHGAFVLLIDGAPDKTQHACR